VGVCLQRGLIVLVISQGLMTGVSYFGGDLLVHLGQDLALVRSLCSSA
jgi:hypothetical protein